MCIHTHTHTHTHVCAPVQTGYGSGFRLGGGGLVTKSCPTIATPWALPLQVPLSIGFLQARILEWVAISFSREFFHPRDRTQVSCTAGRFFTN